ncbi:DNA ligase [Nocardioides sp. DS6]|uniref:DNA ligase (ATP) n=1 Tax=Nocardioides eburneus TaxID=3231482 RepID=A0ABV3SX81_9ACTN
MLATPGTHVPPGDDWVHEVKWDGIRLLAHRTRDGRPRLWTRNENDATLAWPEIAGGGPSVSTGRDLLVDGEAIALNDRGVPDLRVLGERMHVRDARRAARFAEQRPATYMVFDVLRLDGRDLTGLPWTERRAVLEGLAESGEMGGWQVPAAYDDGGMLHEVTREQGLEGIVSKRRTSRYLPGVRTKEWLKFPHRFRGSYVVGGWRPQIGTTDRLAALLVGQPTPAGLVYRGRVGSGIGARESRQLRSLLTDAAASPFAGADVDPAGGVPREDVRGTFWVEPRVVVDVETHGRHVVGAAVLGRLRQPAFIAVRPDLGPEDLL